ncbi:MAG: hypothetical protein GW763_12395 [Paraglaciecola sp.]|nr:hypothetical protein [Paraglaciecola sp.]NCT48763.1 hypothetical protein [Paraglaciecola sp.]
MSGIVKAAKKVFKAVTKPVRSIAKNVVKVVKKVVKSKAFKVIAIGAAIYFGGAALMSMAGGGTASAGLGSAWGGLQGAGSAIASGNVSGAFSALSSGFTGGAAAGATGTFASGQALTNAAIAGNAAPAIAGAAAPAVNTVGVGSTAAGYSPEAMSAWSAGQPTASAVTSAGAATTGGTSSGLLSNVWNGLGEAGKSAVITSGVNMAGQMLQGQAEEDALEESRKRRTYWGMDGEGNNSALPNGGLLSYAAPNTQQGQSNSNWKTTLDDLIQKQKNVVGGYGG